MNNIEISDGTWRRLFAGLALNGLLSGHRPDETIMACHVVDDAVSLAEALIERLDKKL